jgi:hypothetical protein
MKYVVALLSAALAGCASSSNDVAATYVSPIQFQNHTCKQLGEEAEGVSRRAAQLAGAQDSRRSTDAVATTVAVVVFWPALFAVKGDGVTTAELARTKGEMEAIEKASIQKKCGITFQRAPAAS